MGVITQLSLLVSPSIPTDTLVTRTAVFWDVAWCGLLGGFHRVVRNRRHHIRGTLKIVAAGYSQIVTSLLYLPADSFLLVTTVKT